MVMWRYIGLCCCYGYFFYTDIVCLLAGGMMKNLKDLQSSQFEFSMCICGLFFVCVFRLNVIIILVSWESTLNYWEFQRNNTLLIDVSVQSLMMVMVIWEIGFSFCQTLWSVCVVCDNSCLMREHPQLLRTPKEYITQRCSCPESDDGNGPFERLGFSFCQTLWSVCVECQIMLC
jgi:hypothetical protein